SYAATTVSPNFFIDASTSMLVPGRYRVADINNDGRDDLIFGVDQGDDPDPLNHSGEFKYRCLTWNNVEHAFFECMIPEAKDWSHAAPQAGRWYPKERIRWPLWNLADVDGDGRMDLVENAHIRRNLETLANGQVLFEPTQEPTELIDFGSAPGN